jgi:hypothetical protein
VYCHHIKKVPSFAVVIDMKQSLRSWREVESHSQTLKGPECDSLTRSCDGRH